MSASAVSTRDALVRSLRPPPEDGTQSPYLAYRDAIDVNWSDELAALHEESSRDHFIDVATRETLLGAVRDRLAPGAVVADLGCSDGYLLSAVAAACPGAVLAGVDLVERSLLRARGEAPDAVLLLADILDLPFEDQSVDVVISANVLEHIADHRAALIEIRRVLRPGGRAALIVPAGRGLFDYYDAFLGHQRRYGRRELAGLARAVGYSVVDDLYVGSLLYPAFWAVKKGNRLRHRGLEGSALAQRVGRDISRTQDSRIGNLTRRLEAALVRRGVRLSFGIRNCVVLDRP